MVGAGLGIFASSVVVLLRELGVLMKVSAYVGSSVMGLLCGDRA